MRDTVVCFSSHQYLVKLKNVLSSIPRTRKDSEGSMKGMAEFYMLIVTKWC
jgi:hypothetical protein